MELKPSAQHQFFTPPPSEQSGLAEQTASSHNPNLSGSKIKIYDSTVVTVPNDKYFTENPENSMPSTDGTDLMFTDCGKRKTFVKKKSSQNLTIKLSKSKHFQSSNIAELHSNKKQKEDEHTEQEKTSVDVPAPLNPNIRPLIRIPYAKLQNQRKFTPEAQDCSLTEHKSLEFIPHSSMPNLSQVEQVTEESSFLYTNTPNNPDAVPNASYSEAITMDNIPQLHIFYSQTENSADSAQLSKSFVCKVCQKQFSRNYDLKRHQRMHDGVKPYLCECCSRSFSRQDALQRHLRSDYCSPIRKLASYCCSMFEEGNMLGDADCTITQNEA